jgi:cobalt-zinc-cadmium efflux system protein
MEASPTDVDVKGLAGEIMGVTGVCGVHDLHVWRIGNNKTILSAHVDVENEIAPFRAMKEIEDVIGSYGIVHSTVQLCVAQQCIDVC